MTAKDSLGFINASLFRLASQENLFTDISNGDNKPSANYPGYEAGPGLDTYSGWGTPIADKLIDALVNLL